MGRLLRFATLDCFILDLARVLRQIAHTGMVERDLCTVIATSAPARMAWAFSGCGRGAVGLVTVLVALQHGGSGGKERRSATAPSVQVWHRNSAPPALSLPGISHNTGSQRVIISPSTMARSNARHRGGLLRRDRIDATQWIAGHSNLSYPNGRAEIGGLPDALWQPAFRRLCLQGGRSPTFFDAKSPIVAVALPLNERDIGFYRVLPPLRIPPGGQSSIDFVVARFNSTNNRLMYVRSQGRHERAADRYRI